MQAYISRPDGTPRGGIIVIQEAFGVTGFIRSVADRFAQEGFLAIAPEYFHRTAAAGFEAAYGDYPSVMPHMEGLTLDGQRADAHAAFDWLKKEGVKEVSALGFCMGGRATFMANSSLPLKAAVSFYGGGMDQLLELVPKQHAPLLLLWGEKDAHITPDKRRIVLDAFDAAKKSYVDVVFSDADHAFFRDVDPSKYHQRSAKLAWPLVLEFLK